MGSKKKPTSVWVGIIAAFLAVLWWGANQWLHQQTMRALRAEIQADLTVYGNFLSNEINRQFAKLSAISAFAQSHIVTRRSIDSSNFNLFVEGLRQNSEVIRNFSIAPGGVQKYVYPMRRNQPVSGHNLLKDPRPQVRADVKRTIETGRIVISGPYELRQGGLGLIARKALFESTEFWGLTAIVIDLPPILKILETGKSSGQVAMALRREKKTVFWGNPAVFSSLPEIIRIHLPDGEWELGGIPDAGWDDFIGERVLSFKLVSFIVLILMITITHLLFNRHSQLKTAVLNRTREIAKINETLQKDIEERKKTEHKLRESEQMLKESHKIAKMGQWRLDLLKDELWWSDEIYTIFQIEQKKIGASYQVFLDAVHPDDRKTVDSEYRESIKNMTPYDIVHRLLRKDGKVRYVHDICRTEYAPDSTPLRSLGTIQDITERVMASEELKRKNVYLSTLHDTALGMLNRLDLSVLLEKIVKGATSLTHFSIGFLHLYNPETALLEIKAGTGFFSDMVGFRVRPGEGLAGKVWQSAKPMLVKNYRTWSGRLGDKRFDPVVSMVGIPLKSGSSTAGVLGLCSSETEKTIDPEIVLILEQFAELAAIAIDNAQLHGHVREELEKRKALEVERKKMEVQLRQAQKMEAIGALAGGIAHDFNNMLFPIIGYVDMMLHDIKESNPLKKPLKEVFSASMRAKELVKQILTFSRQGDQEIQPVKIQSIVTEAMQLARSTLPSTITIRQNIDPECGMIMADPTQIHQVVMNLVTNAYHAMQEKDSDGSLNVVLKKKMLTTDNLPDTRFHPGNYVCLSISDTGSGIDAHILDRIFDPYFTTKQRGKGTGLGLSVVHGIVKSHNGEILVKSKVGKGTVFDIYFPQMETARPISEKGAVSIRQGHARGNEKILLVDDEEAVIQTIKQILEKTGYSVEAITNSQKALDRFTETPNAFDLVITDMTMPDLTGDRLAVELLKIRPDLPIIIITGFNEKLSSELADEIGIKGFLMKPVVISELTQKIRSVLPERSIDTQ